MFGGTFELVLFDVVRDKTTNLVRKVEPESTTSFRFSKLSLSGSETLDNWIRSRHLKAVELASRELPTDVRNTMLEAAANKAANLCWNSDYGLELLQCVDGITLLAAVCISQHHPNADRNDLRDRICLAENMLEVTRLLRESSSAGELKSFISAAVAPQNRQQKRKKLKQEQSKKRRS